MLPARGVVLVVVLGYRCGYGGFEMVMGDGKWRVRLQLIK